MNESWIEKFRPTNLDEIESQEEVISSLKNCIKIKNIPHLLFFGPSGCGKTSTILALAKELFGDKYWHDRVIELNASDERGIKVVRDKIKRYAMTSINSPVDDNMPPWKIIILDEADNMTSDSQFALRKIMEDYSKVTRFCIICNYYNKIIDPIISRCSMYRFKLIPKELICKKLTDICKIENTIISNDNIELIERITRGDMRKAINFLQRCRNFKNFMSNTNNISSVRTVNTDIIENISGIMPIERLTLFIENSIDGNMDIVDKMIDGFYKESYSLTIQIPYIIDIIINHKKLNDKMKSLISQKILSIDNYLLNGCDENIQYNRLAYSIMSIRLN
jgi:replication factor C subunit 2/4